MKLDIL